jgi:hypothetical protein
LAALIASRSVQLPGFGSQLPSLVSAVVLTVKSGPVVPATVLQSENSEVLPAASVAVAVIAEPGAT